MPRKKVKKTNSVPLKKKAAKPDPGREGPGASSGGPGDRKTSCVKKKTKKIPQDRQRSGGQDLVAEVEPVTTIVEEKKTPEPLKDGGGSYEADVKVPSLPTPSQADREKEDRARARRNLIDADYLRADLKPGAYGDMLEEAWADFDADITSNTSLSKNPIRMSSWLTGRLALSQQASRFTLPMDMKLLETMSPQEYLRKYCIISSRRHILYQKIFSKNRDKTGVILYKDLEKSLKEVLVNSTSHSEVVDLCKLMDIDHDSHVDYQLFCGLAAFAERILYPKFVTDDTAELPDFQREKIECADFCALDWKFHGVNVNPPVRKLLKSLG